MYRLPSLDEDEARLLLRLMAELRVMRSEMINEGYKLWREYMVLG